MRTAFKAATLVLGAAAACRGAVAQEVSMYGVIDVPVERLSKVASGSGSGPLWRQNGLSGMVPSRLGFRGTEDLGSGLRAEFNLEMGILPDSGVLGQGGRGFGRAATVGLSGDWGRVTLGRQYVRLFHSLTEADILGPSMYGSGSLDSYFSAARADNMVAYLGKWGGLTGGVSYSLGRDVVGNCAGESADDKQACRAWSVLAKYNAADWGLAFDVDVQRGGSTLGTGLTSSSKTDRRVVSAGWVRWAGVKFGAGLVQRTNEGNAATPRSRLAWLGASHNLTPSLTLEAQYHQMDFKNSSDGAKLFVARAVYHFSRRTAVYAMAGDLSNDGVSAYSLTPGAAPPAGATQTGVATGITHRF